MPVPVAPQSEVRYGSGGQAQAGQDLIILATLTGRAQTLYMKRCPVIHVNASLVCGLWCENKQLACLGRE